MYHKESFSKAFPYLNSENFVKWLKHQPPKTTYQRNSACACPLANYINKNIKETKYISVGVMHINVYFRQKDTYASFFKTPVWMIDFIKCVDNREKGETITAYECLEYLQNNS
jgi:hypothetical protein